MSALLVSVGRAPGRVSGAGVRAVVHGVPSQELQAGGAPRGRVNGEPRNPIWGTPLRGQGYPESKSLPSLLRWPMDERDKRRSSYPLTIPDALLQSEDMRRACAARDFKEIFRLVNRRTGSSHAVMAAAVGKMTSSRVSDIIRGVRGIRGHEVIERVADGFGIPGGMLDLPERPWESLPTIPPVVPDEGEASALLPLVVNGRKVMVPVGGKILESLGIGSTLGQLADSSSSVGEAIWNVECEPVSPLDRRTILKSGISATALVSFGLGEIQHVTEALADSYRYLDGPVVEYFQCQLETAKSEDGALGAQKTLPVVLGLVSAIEEHTRDVKPAVRRDLLSVGADGAEFVGWLYRDLHQSTIAALWYDRAMEWAQEAGDAAMQGYMLLKKSQMAYDDGDPVRMLTLAQAAQHERWKLPTRVRAELLQQEALACAMLGEPFSLVEQKLGAAHELLTDAADTEPRGLGGYFNESTLLLRNAVSYIEAGKPGLAAGLFGEVIAAGTLSRRDAGFFSARRAVALALSGEPDEAARVGKAAAEVAEAVKSERTMRVLGEVSQTLGRWRDRPAVREFREALRAA